MEEHNQLNIGEKIREQRKKLGITINEISKRTNLTASFISQFERGRTKASMDSVKKIAESIGLDFSDLFGKSSTNQPASIIQSINNFPMIPYLVRKNDRPKLSHPAALNDSSYDYLLSHPTNNLQVHIIDVEPGDVGSKKLIEYGSEQFILILEGQFEFQIEENTYILSSGDSLTFNGSLNWIWKNTSNNTTKLLWVHYN